MRSAPPAGRIPGMAVSRGNLPYFPYLGNVAKLIFFAEGSARWVLTHQNAGGRLAAK